MKEKRFLKIAEVLHKTGLCKSVMYKEIKEGTFPAQHKRGKASLWLESEIDEWIDLVVSESQAA